jgi:hypothetical protein
MVLNPRHDCHLCLVAGCKRAYAGTRIPYMPGAADWVSGTVPQLTAATAGETGRQAASRVRGHRMARYRRAASPYRTGGMPTRGICRKGHSLSPLPHSGTTARGRSLGSRPISMRPARRAAQQATAVGSKPGAGQPGVRIADMVVADGDDRAAGVADGGPDPDSVAQLLSSVTAALICGCLQNDASTWQITRHRPPGPCHMAGTVQL